MLASSNDLEVMIYTGLSLEEFHAKVGKTCASSVGFDMLLTEKMLAENDTTLYAMIGKNDFGLLFKKVATTSNVESFSEQICHSQTRVMG